MLLRNGAKHSQLCDRDAHQLFEGTVGANRKPIAIPFEDSHPESGQGFSEDSISLGWVSPTGQ